MVSCSSLRSWGFSIFSFPVIWGQVLLSFLVTYGIHPAEKEGQAGLCVFVTEAAALPLPSLYRWGRLFPVPCPMLSYSPPHPVRPIEKGLWVGANSPSVSIIRGSRFFCCPTISFWKFVYKSHWIFLTCFVGSLTPISSVFCQRWGNACMLSLSGGSLSFLTFLATWLHCNLGSLINF